MDNNLKKQNLFLILTATALISCILTASVMSYPLGGRTFYISGGPYPRADYTVSYTDGIYYAKSIEGLMATYGAGFSVVLQFCIDNLTEGGAICISPGTFYTQGVEINVTIKGITIFGEGYSTKIVIDAEPSHSVFVVTKSNFCLRDLYINATIAKTNGAAVALVGATEFEINLIDRIVTTNEIKNVMIENQWEGIRLESDTRMVYITNVDIRNSYDKAIGLNNCSFVYLNKVTTFNWVRPYNYSLHIMNGYSIYAAQCEFLNAQLYGVLSNPATGIHNAWMYFTDCAVETNNTATGGDGWVFTDNQGGGNTGIKLEHCWAVSNRYGIVFDGVNSSKIDNCVVHGNDRHGVWLQSEVKNVQITDSQIGLNSRETTATYDDVRIDAGNGNFTITGNTFFGSAMWGETKKSNYAVNIVAGASNWYIIADNLAQSHNTIPSLYDGGTGLNKTVTDNIWG